MIFFFDRYTLDSETRTLSSQGTTITLTPKVFQVLLVLVENRTRVMSKDELFEQVWPGQTVEEANITQSISMLRKALEGVTRGKQYIATFHGYGYRFVEPVILDGTRKGAALQQLTESEPHPPSIAQTKAILPSAAHQPTRRWLPLAVAGLLLGLAVLAILYIRVHQAAKTGVAQPVHMATLTRMEGAQYQPAWSPDGKQLAFIASDLGRAQLGLLYAGSGDVKPPLLMAGNGDYSSPAWSPDGKFLAFIHTQPDSAELIVLSLADSVQRKLTTLFPHRYSLNYRHLDWSPDGDFIAVDDKTTETDPLSLYLVHVSDGNKIRLTYPNMDMIGDVAPRFSPDGTRVAFIRLKYQLINDVFVSPVTGGETRRLTDQSHSLGDIDWRSNDSLFFSGKLDSEFRFWQFDLRNPTLGATLASTIGTDLPTQFSIARTSGRLAYSAFAPDLNIWSLDLTQRPGAPAAWNTVIQTPGEDIEPSFSPDGTRVAFLSDQSGKIQLWVSTRDGSQASRIDTKNLTPSFYCWTRDGTAIIFVSLSAPGLFEVSLKSPYSLRRITDLPYNRPSLSVDGKSVFAIHSNYVYRVAIADGAVQKVSDQGGGRIAQSKDARYLYFTHGRMDPTISCLDLQTGSQTVVVSSLFPGYSDSWALTRKGILFLKMESGHLLIELHDFATRKEITVAGFRGILPPVGFSAFAISPDERTLFVVRGDPISTNIQAIDLGPATKH